MEIYRNYSYGSNIVKNLNYFLGNDKFIDVRLKVGDKEYPCHKILLIASSLYFEKMFSHGFQERTLSVIELFDTSKNGFDNIYNYIYTGEIYLTKENVMDIYDVSDRYLYDSVREKSLSYILADINASNCLDYFNFAHQRGLDELTDRCVYNMIHLFQQACFLNDNLISLPLDTFSRIIMSDDISYQEELKILQITCDWIENNEISTEQKDSLLNGIRWGLFELKDFQQVDRYAHVLGDTWEMWKALITKYTRENCNKKMAMELQHSYHFRYRSFKMKAFVGGYDSMNDRILSCIRWPFANGPLILLPTPICYPAALTVGNHIVTLGGKSEQGVNTMTIDSYVRAYDIRTKLWHSLERMKKCRWQHVAIALNGYILIVGGRDEKGGALDSVEKYDISQNRWLEMKPFVKKMVKLKGCCLNGTAYVCGGYYNNTITNYTDTNRNGWRNKNIYKYNEKDDEWVRVCTLPKLEKHRRSSVTSMCTINNKIYVTGYDKMKYLVFDPVTKSISHTDIDPEIPLLDSCDVLLPRLDSLY